MFLRASVEDARRDIDRKRQAVVAAAGSTAGRAGSTALPSAGNGNRMAAAGAATVGSGSIGSPQLRGGSSAVTTEAASVYASLSREEREGVLASLLAQEAVLSALQVCWQCDEVDLDAHVLYTACAPHPCL